MFAQEDDAHAAFAEAFEEFEFVGDEEVAPLALQELFGLEARQQAVADHGLGQFAGALGTADSRRLQRKVVVETFPVENAAFLAEVEQFVDCRWRWHRRPSGLPPVSGKRTGWVRSFLGLTIDLATPPCGCGREVGEKKCYGRSRAGTRRLILSN